eukprot:766225-Rhodomonas_salina.3
MQVRSQIKYKRRRVWYKLYCKGGLVFDFAACCPTRSLRTDAGHAATRRSNSWYKRAGAQDR